MIQQQIDIGLDWISDGEIERENYFMHFARNVAGIDFDIVDEKSARDGACIMKAPVITGKVEIKNELLCWKEWEKAAKIAQELSQNAQVKFAIPGPMTLLEGLSDRYYGPDKRRQLIEDTIRCINQEILGLVEHGCKLIQVDEPVLMRHPQAAKDYGIDDVVKCLEGVPEDVKTVVHLCCGYPTFLDQDDYKKADKEEYKELAPLLDKSGIFAVSIEDAECLNDLESLLSGFKSMTVMLGSVKVARSRVESADEIESRLRQALQHIDADRLVVGPDCGLGFLPEDLIMEKMKNMMEASRRF